MKPSKIQPALIGGAAAGVASAIPIVNFFNCACCALVIGGGVLAAALYLKEAPPTDTAPMGDGAIVGLLAGVIASFITTLVNIPIQLVTSQMGLSPDISDLEEAFAGADLPPEALDFIASMLSGGLSIGVILFGFIINLFFFSIFGTLGGVIGAAIFKKS